MSGSQQCKIHFLFFVLRTLQGLSCKAGLFAYSCILLLESILSVYGNDLGCLHPAARLSNTFLNPSAALIDTDRLEGC